MVCGAVRWGVRGSSGPREKRIRREANRGPHTAWGGGQPPAHTHHAHHGANAENKDPHTHTPHPFFPISTSTQQPQEKQGGKSLDIL